MTCEEASGKGRELSAGIAENSDATQAEIDEAAAWMNLRESLFMGNTLRGLLPYGYAFATIAGIAAVGAYVGSALFLALGLLGLLHARRAARTATAGSDVAVEDLKVALAR